MVQALESGSLSDDTANKVGAALACIRYQRTPPGQSVGRSWQGFHFSDYQADQALSRVEKQLDVYKIQDKEWPYLAIDREGTKFSCSPYSMD